MPTFWIIVRFVDVKFVFDGNALNGIIRASGQEFCEQYCCDCDYTHNDQHKYDCAYK